MSPQEPKPPPYYRRFAPKEHIARERVFRPEPEQAQAQQTQQIQEPMLTPITSLTVLAPFVRDYMASPKLEKVDRRVRAFMLKELEKLAEEETQDASDAIDMTLKYPSATSFDDCSVRCIRVSRTCAALATATGDPLWFRLANNWAQIANKMDQYQIRVAEARDQGATDEKQLEQLERDITVDREEAGAALSHAFHPYQSQIAQ